MTLEKNTNNFFQTNLELQINLQEEESFHLAEECSLCEKPTEDNLSTEGASRGDYVKLETMP